jgi:hypothetical protein
MTRRPPEPSDDPSDRALEQVAPDDEINAAQDAAIDEVLERLAL